ncbi:uncharacterized protein Z520_09251 [Fonsecaea multimorphosa CBS 102226]|uniref:F-box domain-containing protein n=1 Tax=Fonsecaea multimorphosa CBS 102226 TaxID=1442371 RepID=A0A0D2ICW1_9EURO|nr:uncharacterized protein Z520_09251 [Fonsecaea multimorphosa CBS 102226]KIX94941.1 hypothetical protein Z520_09251 [Fonsecaea multimorphosa CBS 102226]OAL20592.1 hypothetical protein AYO22_08601 [Fonsecaea multimorphosa]
MASLTDKPLEPASISPDEFRFLSKQPDYNKVLIDAEELRRRIWLSSPQSWATRRSQRTRRSQQTSGLGDLDKLPLELQMCIFAATPVSSLINLRATNSHAKQLIEQWEPFRVVMMHGPDAIRALLATGAGCVWTVPQVVDVLFTSKCEFCGEHGEILHLLQLKRCCFRCLSQERELLAVNLGYAQNTMGLSQAQLRKLPQLVTVPQNCFWGFPGQKGHLFDYKAAMDVLRQQGPLASTAADQADSTPCQIPLMPTGLELTAEQRSIQPRPRSPIQARRHQTPLRLLKEEISPPETTYAQHACAIRCPPLRRQTTRKRLRDGSLQTTMSKIEAVHCAGCAYFWNYHSPLPWQFHRLYPHQPGEADTEFNRHLKHCVYARMQWRWLYGPWRRWPRERVEYVLRNFRLSYRSRHGAFNVAEENALFEKMTGDAAMLMHTSDSDFTTFSPQYTWPDFNNGDEDITGRQSQAIIHQLARMRAIANRHPIDKRDYYWDSLVSQEAVSQANWACANALSGKVSLFRGPVTILAEKKQLYDKKFRSGRTSSGRLPEWGFGHFYL